MKRHSVTYEPDPPTGPMSPWIKDRVLPVLVPGRGYPLFHVEIDGMDFVFATLQELDECIDVLGRKLLPASDQLRQGSSGPNRHWLARLPAFVKPWKFREKAVAYLRAARAEFIDEVEGR
jgi:hypothetical protein